MHKLSLENQALKNENQRARLERAELEQKIIRLEKNISTVEEQKASALREAQIKEKALQDHIRTKEELFQKDKERFEKSFQEMKENLKTEFQNISQNIFEKKAKDYKSQSEESIGHILNPLKQQIADFEKLVSDYYAGEGKARHSLSDVVQKLSEAHEKSVKAVARLDQTVKGGAKVLGDYGEMILERLLKASGLREGEEFFLQGKGLHLKGAAGENVKPDVVIRLPGKGDIVIDSKTSSLAPYQEYIQAGTEEERREKSKRILSSLKKHISDLSETSYHSVKNLKAPGFTFLFIPHEGILLAALNQDPSVFDAAWKKQISIVTPNTLASALQTVVALWNMERQNKNAEKIAEQGGKMYDGFARFLEYFEDMGKNLEKADKSYERARSKLFAGRTNLISQAENLKKLGVNVSKPLPDRVSAG